MSRENDFMVKLFSYIESITNSKVNIMHGEEDEKFYGRARFQIHRALSFYPDLISIVNMANAFQGMAPRIEYEFFLKTIPSKIRRSGRWPKKSPTSVYMKSVQEYYGYNEAKAEDAMKLLTVEQMAMIETKIRKEDSWTSSEDTASKYS